MKINDGIAFRLKENEFFKEKYIMALAKEKAEKAGFHEMVPNVFLDEAKEDVDDILKSYKYRDAEFIEKSKLQVYYTLAWNENGDIIAIPSNRSLTKGISKLALENKCTIIFFERDRFKLLDFAYRSFSGIFVIYNGCARIFKEENIPEAIQIINHELNKLS